MSDPTQDALTSLMHELVVSQEAVLQTVIEQAEQGKPDPVRLAEVTTNLAGLYQRLGRYAQMAEMTSALLVMAADSAETFAERLVLHAGAVKHTSGVEQALKSIEVALEAAPDLARVHHEHACLLVGFDAHAALGAVKRAIGCGQEPAVLWADDDLAALRSEPEFQNIVAEATARRAIELTPPPPEARSPDGQVLDPWAGYASAVTLASRGQLREAFELVLRVNQLPDAPSALRSLAIEASARMVRQLSSDEYDAAMVANELYSREAREASPALREREVRNEALAAQWLAERSSVRG